MEEKFELQSISIELERLKAKLSVLNDGSNISMAEHYVEKAIKEIDEKVFVLNALN